jgi:hypothetical protein
LAKKQYSTYNMCIKPISYNRDCTVHAPNMTGVYTVATRIRYSKYFIINYTAVINYMFSLIIDYVIATSTGTSATVRVQYTTTY